MASPPWELCGHQRDTELISLYVYIYIYHFWKVYCYLTTPSLQKDTSKDRKGGPALPPKKNTTQKPSIFATCAMFTVGGGQVQQVRSVSCQQRIRPKVCPKATRSQDHGPKLLTKELKLELMYTYICVIIFTSICANTTLYVSVYSVQIICTYIYSTYTVHIRRTIHTCEWSIKHRAWGYNFNQFHGPVGQKVRVHIYIYIIYRVVWICMTFVNMNTVLINCTDRLLEFFHLYAASTLSKGLVIVPPYLEGNVMAETAKQWGQTCRWNEGFPWPVSWYGSLSFTDLPAFRYSHPTTDLPFWTNLYTSAFVTMRARAVFSATWMVQYEERHVGWNIHTIHASLTNLEKV